MNINMGDKFNDLDHPIQRISLWSDLEMQKIMLSQHRSVWALDSISQYGLTHLICIEYAQEWLHWQPCGSAKLLFGLARGDSSDLYTSSNSTGVTFYPLTDRDTPIAFLRSTGMSTVWHELCHMIVPEVYQGEGTHGRCAISVDWLERRLDTMSRLHTMAEYIHQILTAIDNGYSSVSDYLYEVINERRIYGS